MTAAFPTHPAPLDPAGPPSAQPAADRRLRGAVLQPVAPDDAVFPDRPFLYLPDAAVVTDARGILRYLGPVSGCPVPVGELEPAGLLVPPLLDCHTHIPQFFIRGRFLEGLEALPPGKGLLQGLHRNVYPAEARCGDVESAAEVTEAFLQDTLAHGTLGGVAYMTSHPVATRVALQRLPDTWRVGLVLMNQNCPTALAITPAEARLAMEGLYRDFGARLVVTDRFAVAVTSSLRQMAARFAREHGLDTQTHLAEQPDELDTVRQLYPQHATYTHVYEADGLLEAGCIVAHCVHLSEGEWHLLAQRRARVAHCPVSNTRLGSGRMDLASLHAAGVSWALCTDVGASPSTSLLHELRHFCRVHADGPAAPLARPSVGLWHASVGARHAGRIDIGGLRVDHPFAAVEFAAVGEAADADEAITTLLNVGEAPRIRRFWR